jgi:leader peptidase (prepilin peptidase) / N-methyltransferase
MGWATGEFPAVDVHTLGSGGYWCRCWLQFVVDYQFRPVAMAAGDFKLFAALGAWFGWLGLLPIILLASLVGSVIGIAIKMTSGLRDGDFIPFGPFLAGAGFLALFWGPTPMIKAFGF